MRLQTAVNIRRRLEDDIDKSRYTANIYGATQHKFSTQKCYTTTAKCCCMHKNGENSRPVPRVYPSTQFETKQGVWLCRQGRCMYEKSASSTGTEGTTCGHQLKDREISWLVSSKLKLFLTEYTTPRAKSEGSTGTEEFTFIIFK